MDCFHHTSFTASIIAVIFTEFVVDVTEGATNAGEDGLCFRAESLGHREGNLYYCKDPSLPVCCERDNTHTCCETETKRSVNDQVILWGFVCLTVLCFALVYYYFTREGDYWESENIRMAASHMARRFGLNIFNRKKPAPGEGTRTDGDFDAVTNRPPSADSAASTTASTAATSDIASKSHLTQRYP